MTDTDSVAMRIFALVVSILARVSPDHLVSVCRPCDRHEWRTASRRDSNLTLHIV